MLVRDVRQNSKFFHIARRHTRLTLATNPHGGHMVIVFHQRCPQFDDFDATFGPYNNS